MSPPVYSDLGKESRNVFYNHYFTDVVKLNVKTRTPFNFDANLNASLNVPSKKVTGHLECVNVFEKYGLVLKEKYISDNTMCMSVHLKDHFLDGLALNGICTFSSETGFRKKAIECFYKNNYIHFQNTVNFDQFNKKGLSSLVLQHKDFLSGCQLRYDSNNKILSNQFSIAYKQPEYIIHASVTDSNKFLASIYRKLTPKLETTFLAEWIYGSDPKCSIAYNYKLDDQKSVRAKLSQSGPAGLGLTYKFKEGLSVTLSSLINWTDQEAYKFGLGFNFDLK